MVSFDGNLYSDTGVNDNRSYNEQTIFFFNNTFFVPFVIQCDARKIIIISAIILIWQAKSIKKVNVVVDNLYLQNQLINFSIKMD